jgi:hypothetical protein
MKVTSCFVITVFLLIFAASLSAQTTEAVAEPVPATSPEPSPQPSEKKVYKRSLDIDAAISYSYKESFGLVSPESRISYSPMITYSYLLDEYNAIGLVLLRFTHYPMATIPVLTFAYGFQLKHYWHKEWADLGSFIPWASYGILLNYVTVSNQPGGSFGHNTRIGLGTDVVLAPEHHLVIQVDWDSVNYPTLGTTATNGLGSFSFGIGYRLLF